MKSKNLEILNKFEKEEFLKSLKINWVYSSNAIEGNSLNLGDTAFVIEYGLSVKGKSIKDHNEVLGHSKAIDLIYKFIDKDTISKDDIFLLHIAVQTQIVIDIESPIGKYRVVENGRYLKIDNKSQYLPYPHPTDIDHLMDLWFEDFGEIREIKNFDECVEIYTDMHLSFASIHPFFDGNGRLARLVSNIPLLKNGFLPIIVNNEDRQEYIELLSNYNLKSKPLDKNTTKLIEKNEDYQKLKEFFKNQYKNSQALLDEILRSKRW